MTNNKKRGKIFCYTDGSYSQHSKCGAWAFLFLDRGNITIEKGGNGEGAEHGVADYELKALLLALEYIKKSKTKNAYLIHYSDSMYIVDALNLHTKIWKENGWKRSDGKDIALKEYWVRVLRLKKFLEEQMHITVLHSWVKSHSGNEYNERCDRRCTFERKRCEKRIGYEPKIKKPINRKTKKTLC